MDAAMTTQVEAQNQMPSSALLALPKEILIKVLGTLGYRSLSHCLRVCKYLREIIKGTLELLYKLELGASGMRDGPPSPLGISKRIWALRLRRGQQFQRALRGARLVVPTLPTDVSDVHYTTGHLLTCHGPSRSEVGWHSSRVCGIGTHLNGDLGWETGPYEAGVEHLASTADPSQNLLILSEHEYEEQEGEIVPVDGMIYIHIRQLGSPRVPHPSAALPILETPDYEFDEFHNLYVTDDVVAFTGSSPEAWHLFIWNWKTGEMLVNLEETRLDPHFAFLSPRSFVLAYLNEAGHGIRLFQFDDTVASSGSQIQPIVILVMDPSSLRPGQCLTGSNIRQLWTTNAPAGVAFDPDPYEQIHVFFLDPADDVAGTPFDHPTICFVVHAHELRRILQSAMTRGARGPVIIGRETWERRFAAVFELPMRRYQTTTYGQLMFVIGNGLFCRLDFSDRPMGVVPHELDSAEAEDSNYNVRLMFEREVKDMSILPTPRGRHQVFHLPFFGTGAERIYCEDDKVVVLEQHALSEIVHVRIFEYQPRRPF